MKQPAKFELGNPVRFLGKQFVIVRRDYRPHSGNWHYLLRGDKWRIEDDLSMAGVIPKEDVESIQQLSFL